MFFTTNAMKQQPWNSNPKHLAAVEDTGKLTRKKRRKEESLRREKTVIKVVLVRSIKVLCIFSGSKF